MFLKAEILEALEKVQAAHCRHWLQGVAPIWQ
jgi:hypothetical protein